MATQQRGQRGSAAVRWQPNIARLEQARLEKLWSYKDLAREAGLNRQTVSNVLSKRAQKLDYGRPSLLTMQLLARALDVPLKEVVSFE